MWALLCSLFAGPAAEADWLDIAVRGRLRFLAIGKPGPESQHVHQFGTALIEGFAKLHRLQMEPVPVVSGFDLIPALRASKADLMPLGPALASRGESVAFSVGVFPIRYCVVTRKPQPAIRTLEQLRATRRVGILKGALEEMAVEAGVPAANRINYRGIQPLEALKSGRADALVRPVDKAVLMVQQDPDVEIGLFVGPLIDRAFAVRQEDTVLLARLNEYLTHFQRSGSWNRLVVSVYGEKALPILQLARSYPATTGDLPFEVN